MSAMGDQAGEKYWRVLHVGEEQSGNWLDPGDMERGWMVSSWDGSLCPWN